METEKKIASSINLPVETLFTIIDVNDRNVEVGIESALSKFKNNNVKEMYSLNTQVTVNDFSEMQNSKNIDLSKIVLNHEEFQITKIERKKIEKTNELKFYRAVVDFNNGVHKEFIVPSYVKFYSSRRGIFNPIEFIRNRDILLDYTGNIVKIADAELVEDFQMTDFYNINVLYNTVNIDTEEDANNDVKHLNETYNFYLNGILANVPYNNFQKKEKEA